MHEVYLGLGSNLGDREQQLRQAVRLVDERVGRVVRQSSFIQTEPWGFQSEHLFLNAAICCLTDKTPPTWEKPRRMPPGEPLIHHPSSIIHLPSSIFHLPSSIIHHPSSITTAL